MAHGTYTHGVFIRILDRLQHFVHIQNQFFFARVLYGSRGCMFIHTCAGVNSISVRVGVVHGSSSLTAAENEH
jgi:hypothetical protein